MQFIRDKVGPLIIIDVFKFRGKMVVLSIWEWEREEDNSEENAKMVI